MPTLEKNIITPDAATGLVQGSYASVTEMLPLSAVLTDSNADNPTSVSWTPNKRRDQRMADFTAFGANLPYTRQDTQQTAMAGLLKLGVREMVGERDIAVHGATPEFLRNKLQAYLTQIGTEIAWRVESARLSTLFDAKFSVQNTVYDYERDKAHEVSLAVAKKWDATGVDPVADILGWQNLVRKNTGVKPTVFITTSDVLDILAENPQFIAHIPNYVAKPSRIGRDDVEAILRNMCAIDSIVVLDEMYSGLGVRLPEGFTVPEKTVLLAPNLAAYELGRTVFGATAAAQSAEYGINNPNGVGLVGYVTADSVPVTYDAVGEGTVLPVLENADLTLKAVVA